MAEGVGFLPSRVALPPRKPYFADILLGTDITGTELVRCLYLHPLNQKFTESVFYALSLSR
ncbi:hypothetical protein Hypma_006059 [Hypsizygus marmoreus]|uniref:Uncharacterized protein n=1 Tax=Hypsizygus marmoreus TaxID=39966 RepID=A0A369K6B3_HYPMA|nr:hypothetical protein Hypma_006059 [Hypsizygus marmoreus]